jgi:hypothetical protein
MATETLDGPPAGAKIVPSSRPASRPPPPTRTVDMAKLMSDAPTARTKPATAPRSAPAPVRAVAPPAEERTGAEDPPVAAPRVSSRPAQDKLDAALQTAADKAEADKNVPRPGEEENTSSETAATETDETETPVEGAIVPQPVKKEKVNPWTLAKQREKERDDARAELSTFKASVLPENDRTALTARVEKAEARAKELEDHIRYVDYEKSTEFKEKFDAPYVQAWERAMSELSEITVIDSGTGQPRAVTADDLVRLANMPLQAAQDAADELFGKFSSYAMTHRAEIKKMSAARAQALKDARENGATREQQTRDQTQKQLSELTTFTKTTFKAINEAILADPKIGVDFQPHVAPEGQELTADEKADNEALAAGYKLVDDGWAANPTAPGLTPEQRKEIIAKHAAIRNRAAGWKKEKIKNRRLEKALAAAQKELEQYRASEPPTGGGPANGGNGRHVSAKDGLFRAIETAAMQRR